MNDWNGRHILIVGASEGIGRETAMLCARRGARLSLVARHDSVKKVAAGLDKKGHQGFCFDVAAIEKIEDFIKNVVEIQGPLDGMVYCVGPQCVRPLRMLNPGIVNEIITNGFGAYIELVRSVTKKNHFNQPMSIVSISSIASRAGSPGKTVYSAMKAAVDAANRSLAVELAPKGIRLNSDCPGVVNTKRLESLQEMVGSDGTLGYTEKRQYLGISQATDIAEAICFLLGEESKMITGTNMDISGGFLTS